MSRGIFALDKDDQRAVLEWRRLQRLSAACDPPSLRPVIARFVAAFALGYGLASLATYYLLHCGGA